MKTAFMKAIIEDLHVTNCEQKQVDALLNCYEGIVKKMAAMLAREATFEIDDFYRAKERGIAGFTLKIEKTHYGDTNQWWGVLLKVTKRSKPWQRLRSWKIKKKEYKSKSALYQLYNGYYRS